jgi:hypothetical protein
MKRWLYTPLEQKAHSDPIQRLWENSFSRETKKREWKLLGFKVGLMIG